MMLEGMKLVGIKYDLWLKTNFMPSHLIPTTGGQKVSGHCAGGYIVGGQGVR